MMRRCFILIGLALTSLVEAKEYPALGESTERITIYSTTDTSLFEPVLRDFQELNPGSVLQYELLDAAPLYERFLAEEAQGRANADVLLSTAMDLQVKLVNDGYAAPHDSANARALPGWARWRDEAFGFTYEPAVMVFNKREMRGRRWPTSRGELLDSLKSDPQFWKGRIGTYDISRSSVGYLLASQDARQSSEFGALIEAFADADMQIEENTSTLLDRLESGNLTIGYNLLGSYAHARVSAGAPFVIVYPQDHTLVVSRTAVIPKSAPNADGAHRFLEYLLSLRGQEVMATRSRLPAVRSEIDEGGNRMGMADAQVGLMRPIALGPGLLVYLDKLKQRRLLASWRAIIGVIPES
jgi:iron(III) transport system substrate-binding protein